MITATQSQNPSVYNNAASTNYLSFQSRESSLNINVQTKGGDSFELSYQSKEMTYERFATSGKASHGKHPHAINMEDFKSQLQEKLIEMIEQAKGKAKENGVEFVDSILYAVDPDTEVPEVPEYWNAENTSQRIVDFALSFQSAFEGEGSEFQERIVDAIKEGYKQAKEMLGDLPGPAAKLFNDTYELTMEKLDQHFGKDQNNEVANQLLDQQAHTLDLVA